MIVFIAQVKGQRAELTPEESWHCSKVLRKSTGDAVKLIDGKGNFYDAVLDIVSEKKCTAKITYGPVPEDPALYHLHLAVAPTKQIDRTEWMLEKAVEIGLHEISFFYSERSERDVLKIDRMMKIVESAAKQSMHATIPVVNEMQTFRHFIKKSKADHKYIAHCTEKPKKLIRTIDFKKGSHLIMIGPEGDFTPAEIEDAREQQFEGLDLGNSRLRSETAGLYVCLAASILTMP
jgi:16S rRNA (uracil1498-N3)-methyltransferase